MKDPTPPTPPSADPDLEEERPSTDFARALESFEGEGGHAPSAAADVSVGSRVRATVVSVGDEHLLLDIGGRSEAVAETKRFKNPEGALSVKPGEILDLYVVEAGDQIVLAPSMRAEPNAALAQVREAHTAGIPVSGRVTGVNAGGLSVDIAGVRGFCPFSQVEAGFCPDPSIYLSRTLEFLVTEVKAGKGGVVLSRKKLLRRAEEESARRLLATLKVGDELDGKVARLEAFGAFVDLGGVDGMVHVSEIRHERTGHPREALSDGEQVRVRVLRIEAGKDGRPRIGLSIKAARPDPWEGIEKRYTKGARVQGTVARLADFGAFVNLEPGIDGLVHVSEASPQRVGHVKEVLAVGQPVEAVVLDVDAVKRRISLSIRSAIADALPPARSPQVGDVLEGRVAGIKPFGVFVDLPDYGSRVSGMLPREEGGQGRGTDLKRTFSIGQTLEVEVTGIKEGKIRVSLKRMLGAADEPRAASTASSAPAKGEEPPMTTMAMALRKAMEEAKEKERQGRSRER